MTDCFKTARVGQLFSSCSGSTKLQIWKILPQDNEFTLQFKAKPNLDLAAQKERVKSEH